MEASVDIALRFHDAAATPFAHITDMPGIGERWPTSNPRLVDKRDWRIECFENHLNVGRIGSSVFVDLCQSFAE